MRRLQLCGGELHDFGERFRVMHSKIGQDLSIDADLLLVQSGDQARIGNLVQACSGVNPGDPQGSKFPFLRFAVAIGVRPRFVDVVFCNGVNLASGAPESFGLREEFLSSPMGCDFVL
jgi:hypothetical protein